MDSLKFGEVDDEECLVLAAMPDQAIDGLINFTEQMGRALNNADGESLLDDVFVDQKSKGSALPT